MSVRMRHRRTNVDTTPASLGNTWRSDGARFIADGGISASDVVATLDATEPA
jgi:hypothetical protein